MHQAHAALQFDHLGFDLGCPQFIGEFQAERDHDLLWRQMDRDDPVCVRHALHPSCDPQDGIMYALIRALADEQALGFSCEQYCRHCENKTDQNRGCSVQDRKVQPYREVDAGEGDQQADEGGAVLEQHDERRWILAVADRPEKIGIALFAFEIAQGEPPRAAVEQSRKPQDDVIDPGILNWLGVQDVTDAFIEGDTCPERENEKGDGELQK